MEGVALTGTHRLRSLVRVQDGHGSCDTGRNATPSTLIGRHIVRLKRTKDDTREGLIRRAINEAADRHRAEGNTYKTSELLSYIILSKTEIEFNIEVK